MLKQAFYNACVDAEENFIELVLSPLRRFQGANSGCQVCKLSTLPADPSLALNLRIFLLIK